jgi:hypothetical protein
MRPWCWLTPYGFARSLSDVIKAAARRRRRSRQERPAQATHASEERTHGGFITPSNGEVTTSRFAHAPPGVLPPVWSGSSQNDCEGKGQESFEQSFGGE